MKGKTKLLLVGWDAADWQVIDPLLKDGKLPALESLIKGGGRGNISTLNPPLSPILWTSIATGKRAYDHGIKGFAEYDREKGVIEPIKATSRKSKAFWNILNEAGLKTNVINWWPSHPAEKLNGVCVSNFFHKSAPAYGNDWALEKSCIYPQENYDELKELRVHPAELTLAHIWPFIPEAHKLDPENDKVLKPLMRVLAHCCSVHNAVTHLMENTDWDVTAVYYEAIDHFSHLAMKYHPPRQEGIDKREFELYKGIVEAAYRFHDMMLDRLINLAGEDCHILLLSDHGFQSGKLRSVDLPDVPAAPALEHRKYGVLVANGSQFKNNISVYGASLLDITPTVLHLFNLPVGEDMEGKVLRDLWKKFQEVSFIPSWELTGSKVEFMEESEAEANGEVLEQLQELGYLDLPENEQERAMNYELEYNLCQSLLDGNKLKEAEQAALSLFSKFKDLRSAVLYANTLLYSTNYETLQVLFEEAKTLGFYDLQLAFIQAMMMLQTGKPDQAIPLFKQLEDNGVFSTQLFIKLAEAFLIGGHFDDAIDYYKKALKLDEENALALSGTAHCLVEKGEFEKAVGILEKSLNLIYYQPNAHYLVAVCFSSLGYRKEAIQALQITVEQAPKHIKAQRLLAKLQGASDANKRKQSITIVTGMPRSGTSMLMQILYKGGLDILTDEIREKDKHNPRGYFEFEKVKSIGVNNEWIQEARGKVLKVVSPLLRYLPADESYRILWMKRPLTEVIVSQEVMKGRDKAEVMQKFPFEMALNFQKEEERLKRWFDQQLNMQMIEIEYYDCLKFPNKVIEMIEGFLDVKLKNEAIDAIDSSLQHNKLA